MKVKAPSLLKKIIAALSSKTNDLRIRIMIFFLLHKNIDKASLTHSLQTLISHHPHHHKKRNDDVSQEEDGVHLVENQDEEEQEEEEEGKANLMMHYNKATSMTTTSHNSHDMYVTTKDHMPPKCLAHDEAQASGDLTRVLLKESEVEMEMEKEGETEDAVDSRRSMGMVGDVEEEDIDQAADMFIQRFKRQIQLQKQLSLERHQRLLLSNA